MCELQVIGTNLRHRRDYPAALEYYSHADLGPDTTQIVTKYWQNIRCYLCWGLHPVRDLPQVTVDTFYCLFAIFPDTYTSLAK